LRLCTKTGLGALALLSGVIACSPSDFVTYDDVLGVGDGAGDGDKQTKKVDGSSDAHLVLKTGAALTIAKGALDHNVNIGIERPDDEAAVEFVKALPAIKSAASAPYILTPHGTKFMARVTLELPVVSKHKDRQLVAAYLDDEDDRTWKLLDVPTVSNGKAVVELGHFSVVILLDADSADLDDMPDASLTQRSDGGVVMQDAGAVAEAGSGGEWLDAAQPIEPVPSDSGAPASDGSTGANDGGKLEDAATYRPDASMSDAGYPYDAGYPVDASSYDSGAYDDASAVDAEVQLDTDAALK